MKKSTIGQDGNKESDGIIHRGRTNKFGKMNVTDTWVVQEQKERRSRLGLLLLGALVFALGLYFLVTLLSARAKL